MRACEILEAQGEYLMSPFGTQDIAAASEADQLRRVKVDPHSIQHIKNPSEAVQMAAVKHNCYAIQHIKNPSEAAQIAAVSEDPITITYIARPSKAVQRAGILHSVFTLLYIEVDDIVPIVINQCKREIIKDLLKNMSEDSESYDQLYEVILTLNEFVDWPELAIIKKSLVHELEKQRAQDREGLNEDISDEQEQLAAVTQNGMAIQWITNPSEEVKLAAVSYDGYAIRFIKNPSEEVQLAAVSYDGYVIRFIKNPSEQVQIAAVKQFRDAIRYIKNPSIDVLNQCKDEIIKFILISIKDGHFKLVSKILRKVATTNWPEVAIINRSLDHDKNKLNESDTDEQAQIAAVQNDWKYIKKIPDPSERVQLAAVKSKVTAIKYIKNPTPAVQIAACKKSGRAIQYIENPTEQAQLASISRNPNSYRWIKNPTMTIQTDLIKRMAAADHIGSRYYSPVVYNGFFLDFKFSNTVISKNKRELITIMLKAIKHDEPHVAEFILKKLKNTNWPELAVIRKSLDAIEKERRAKGYYDH